MWGIIPAAGKGSRIQPLAFSKELLPVSGRYEGDVRRPRAVFLNEGEKKCPSMRRWQNGRR